MNQKNWIVILAILVVVLVGAVIYFAIGNKSVPNPTNTQPTATNNTNSQNQPTNSQTNTFVPQPVTVLMWPDVKSFNLTNKTFEAKDLNTSKKIKVATNTSTKYYKIVNMAPSPSDYFDFQGLYSLLKNWEGPTWRFTLKGTTQNDGSIMASEIFYTIQ